MKSRVAGRLTQALERQGRRTILSFQQALYARDVHGSSYASVHAYMKGRTTPPLEFLEGAAEELEVRLAWLVAGDGEMTEAEMTAIHEGLRGELLGRLVERHRWLAEASISVRHLFVDVLLAYQLQVPSGLNFVDVDGGIDQVLEHSDDVAFLVLLPLRAWGAVGFDHLPHPSNFIRHMLSALEAALNPRINLGDPLAARPSSLLPRLRRVAAGKRQSASQAQLSKAHAVQTALETLDAAGTPTVPECGYSLRLA